ncbi:alkaline phosphatase [Cupriavidus sp. USMAHM13]|uniref:alkaline phosphatase n=1 Tax=Cupriavidus sp. USMAHM13 TaxID=1389192 RepID=UPI0008A6C533|nr:alkaline phosphatase [Cupriavidus sp. USMAHM13]AOY98471.1 alkaline phosphatase [Cupriavidus sp. USMAHM13]
MNTTIRTSLLAAAAGACLSLPAQAAGEAKNVIFFLGDGMGPTTVTASRIYKYGETGRLNMESLKRTARIKTFSNDAQTTDSAPSMAAYMTGVKMNNEVLSMSSDTKAVAPGLDANNNKTINNCLPSNGKSVPTLLELAKARGKAVGAITTTELTHATPAATYSHICHRDAQYDIAAQAVPGGAGFNAALLDGVDVLMGGGRNHWTPYDATTNKRGRADGRNLLTELQAKGYTVLSTRNEMMQASGGKLVGLFSSNSHLEYEIDRVAGKGEGATQPSLADMTAKAIETLSKNGNGYFLMVEGGRIDHALHGTNAKRALEDTIAFDDAIKRALSMVDLSNTLVVVTADHDHTMTINGYSHRGNPILGTVTDIKTKQTALAADGMPYTTLVFGNGGTPRKPTRDNPALVDTTANDYLQEVGVNMGSPGSETHGGGDVMLFSSGPGSAPLKGTLDNTKVFGVVKSALGL